MLSEQDDMNLLQTSGLKVHFLDMYVIYHREVILLTNGVKIICYDPSFSSPEAIMLFKYIPTLLI